MQTPTANFGRACVVLAGRAGWMGRTCDLRWASNKSRPPASGRRGATRSPRPGRVDGPGPGVLGGKSRHNALVAPGGRGPGSGAPPLAGTPPRAIEFGPNLGRRCVEKRGFVRVKVVDFGCPRESSLHGSLCLASKMDADYEAECKQYFLQLHAIAEEGFQNATGSVTVDDSFRRARMLKLQVPALN